jgi:hypothetical protein
VELRMSTSINRSWVVKLTEWISALKLSYACMRQWSQWPDFVEFWYNTTLVFTPPCVWSSVRPSADSVWSQCCCVRLNLLALTLAQKYAPVAVTAECWVLPAEPWRMEVNGTVRVLGI